ncbi:MAG: anti-sigma factor [Gemmatimonadota bacterium]
MKQHPDERTLLRHLDAETGSAERWEIERHLAECGVCRRLHERYSGLKAEVGRLPSSIEPPAELWQRIAARLEAETGTRRIGAHPLRESRSGWRRGVVAALAIAASISVGVLLGRQLPLQPTRGVDQAAAEAQAVATLAQYDEESYELAVADLEQILVQIRAELQPETVAAIEENLAIIDAAIADSRAALLADPANERLHRHLATNMQMKIGLLRMVTAATTRDI